MKKTSLSALFCIVSIIMYAQTKLQPGDIAIISVNSDEPKNFDFVLLKDIEQSTTIFFTDNAWVKDSLKFRDSEGIITFTADKDLQVGTIITYTEANNEEFSKTGSFTLSTGGDNIIAYQKTDDENFSFLYGVGWAETVSGNWEYVETKSTKTSDIPTSLSIENNTITYLGNNDNYQFNTTLTVYYYSDTILNQLTNSSNYLANNDSAFTPITHAFFIPPKPVVISNTLCEGQNIFHNIIGKNIKLFENKNKTEEFTPGTQGLYSIWVTQTINGKESETAQCDFIISENPQTPEYELYNNEIILINHSNETINWLLNGTEIHAPYCKITIENQGIYSVKYTNESGCESKSVDINMLHTDLNEINTEHPKYQIYNINGVLQNEQNIEYLEKGIYIKYNNKKSSKIIIPK